MRGVKFIFHALKDGIIGLCGGSPPQKSGIVGMLILIAYFIMEAAIIVIYKSGKINADSTVYLLLGSTAMYFAVFFIGALMYDLISYIASGKRRK